MGIGNRIRTEMKKMGISQNKLARLSQISQSGLSSIINEQVSPKEDTLRLIAGALQIPLSDLLDGDAKKSAPEDRDALRRQFNSIYDQLDADARQEALRYLRFLAAEAAHGKQPAAAAPHPADPAGS